MKLTDFIDKAFVVLLVLFSAISVATTFIIIFILVDNSFEFFKVVKVTEFLFGTHWAPLLEPKSFGVLPLVVGTLQIVVGSTLFALPIGLLAAIFLAEYAHKNLKSFLKPALELLAGIPTVVYGYFAITFVTPALQSFFPETEVFNAASGAIVVGIMVLPMIASLCDDAFRSLSKEFKEGAYSLGAFKYEVILQIIIPASIGRIAAAVILSVSRAIGETMAVTLAAGATPQLTLNPLQSIQTMTAYIVQVSLGDIQAGGIEYLTCYAVGLLLFIMTLFLNVFGQKLIMKKSYV